MALTVSSALALAVPVYAGAPAEPITPAQPVSLLAKFAPARVYDTRPTGVTADGQGAALGKLAAGQTRMIGLVGRVGIDHESAGVVLNATVTGAAAAGTLRMWPCAQPKPTATVLSYAPNDTVANTTVIRLASGLLCVSTTTSAHLIIDAVDQFNLGSRFVAEQKRLVNTSTGFGGHRLKAATWTSFTLNAGAQETFLNVTAFGATKPGFLSMQSCPAGDPLPTGVPQVSALNFAAGERIANMVAVPTGTRVCAYSSVAVDLYVETIGGFPARFPAPAAGGLDTNWRLFDTRWSGIAVQPGVPEEVTVGPLPLMASVALVNITVVRPPGAGYITAYECGNPSNTSTLNFTGSTRAHLSMVRLSQRRTVCIRSSVATDLIVDLAGWYTTFGDPLSVGYASTNGCNGVVNPSDWTLLSYPLGRTVEEERMTVTGGTAPYTIEVHDYSGWTHTVITDGYDEHWNVVLRLDHPVEAEGSYPMTVIVHDAAGAQVSTTVTVLVTQHPILC